MASAEDSDTTMAPSSPETARDSHGSLGGTDSLTFRTIHDLDEYRACVDLQRAVWGLEFSEVVPASILRVSAELGGLVAGAFTPDGTLAGFVYGLTGPQDGRLIHWSHMLAVRRTHRSSGVGFRLKYHQRTLLAARGIREMRWTFDPVVADNAHFNLARLGAQVVEYLPDMYGDTGSSHHTFGTDRFLVSWELTAPSGRQAGRGVDPSAPERRAARASASSKSAVPPEDEAGFWSQAPVLNPVQTPGHAGGAPPPVEGPRLRIAIPSDVVGLSRRAPAEARAWRNSTQRAFLDALQGGYRIVGFQRPETADACGFYRLRREGA